MGDKEEDREAGRQRRLDFGPVKHGKGLQAEKDQTARHVDNGKVKEGGKRNI